MARPREVLPLGALESGALTTDATPRATPPEDSSRYFPLRPQRRAREPKIDQSSFSRFASSFAW